MTDQPGRVLSASDLKDLGYQARALKRMLKRDQLEKVRHGAYATPLTDQSHEAAHRRLITATVPRLAPDACVSHTSAAVLHGLPVPPGLGPVHVTRSRQSGQGHVNDNLHIHAAPLADSDIVVIDGILTTSVARTVADSARMLRLGRAVAMADAALHAERLDLEALTAAVAGQGRRVGIARARRMLTLCDGRSEGPGESLSRVQFAEHGMPIPDLQRDLYTDDGLFVGRVDFIWDEYGLVGEFDGKIKYGRDLRPRVPIDQIVYEEKLREDAIRDLDKRVVRWTWADIFSGQMRVKVQRGIDRAVR